MAEHIEPGMTKWRGQLLFEMQAATVVLAQRALEEGKVQRFQAQVALNLVRICSIRISVNFIFRLHTEISISL